MIKQYKVFTLLMLLLNFAASTVFAADRFYMRPTDVQAGTTATLNLILDNQSDYYGFQAKVKLPPGLNVESVSLNPNRAGSSYKLILNNDDDGGLLMATYSGTHSPFNGNSGALVNIEVRVADSFSGGKVSVSNVIFVDRDNHDVKLDGSIDDIGLFIPVSSISIRETLSLKVGESERLTANILPENATDKTVAWSSSNENIVTVDENGNVTAVAPGEALIKAICNNLVAYCTVNVMPIPAESIIISHNTAELEVGQTTTISATVLPEDATDKTVTWTSSDNNIATVNTNGLITAIALGKATITATCGNVTSICEVTVVRTPVTGISLTNTELLMRVGYISDLIAIVRPDNATDKSVTWASSDENIAMVNENGIVTAKAVGTAIITATSVSDPSIKGECRVIVETSTDIIAVTNIALNENSLNLIEGDNYNLIATITPDDATDKTVTWKSSDKAIATVSDDGVVTAIAKGNAIIYASSSNGLTAECAVTVSPRVIQPTGISLTNTELLMREGYTAELIAIVQPDDATDKSVIWTSSDKTIATVDDNGIVTAIKQGNAIISATTVNGHKAECYVTVVPVVIPVTGIILSEYELDMIEGDTHALIATITPDDATDKTITWKSSDRTIATVSEDGVVTAVSAGNATIYASSSNGLTAECAVTVKARAIDPTGISLTNTELLMREGYTAELIAIVHPDNATDKSVTWTSSDESIATVDQNGIVTAIKQGNAIISATTVNGITAKCYVTVVPVVIAVSGITLSDSELEMIEGDTYTLKATITPDDATDKTVTWKSSDRSIATVSEDGVVTAVKPGNAIIYASSSNGLTAECAVTVHPKEIPVTGISLTNTELLMRVGYTAELMAIVRPDNATDKSVTWESSDESIASVDGNGIVTANAVGTTTIIVSSVYDPSIKAVCKVIVEEETKIVAVTGITLSESKLNMIEGDTHTLIATITPDDATDKTVTWKSSDSNIATVSEDGVVTAVTPGNAIIYASSSNGLTAECAVTVNARVIDPTGISLSNTELLMREGYTAELIAIVRPENATDKTVKWTSSDESIATVDNNGIVTAIKQGNAVISATTVNGITAKCYVTVVPVVIAVSGITLSDSELDMIEDDTYTLNATITPDDATDKTVTWKSSDKDVATVSENGVVTAVKAGTAIIYASSSNGLTAECVVTVHPKEIPVTGISLTNTELLMRVGYTAELIAIVRPDNATDKSVTWESSDESIASVDNNGIVTANAVGTTTIIVTSVYDPSIKAVCKVIVEEETKIVAVTGITLSESELYLIEGDTHTLIATITPDDATDKTVTWKSSDRAIVTVSEDGVVTAVAPGTATVYASSSNGLTAECAVTVKPRVIDPTGISLTNTELLMREGYTADLIAIVHPDNATDKTVTWASSDESIAMVDKNGIVTAIKQGKAVISATTVNGIKAECYVTVIPVVIAVTDIKLSDYKLDMIEDDTHTLIATITPDDATDKTVTWKSSDKDVATVSENGVVTAVKAGTAIIYASSSNGLTAECVVTVHPKEIPVTGISLTNTELLMRVGYTAELIAIVRPDNATDKSVTWESSDESIASVDNNGIVTANAVGTTTIIVTSVYDPSIKAVCKVIVEEETKIVAVAGITLSESELYLIEGDTHTLIATITPDDATDKTVTWKSSDRAIVTVSEDGVVTAVAPGTATVYASSSNGLTAECKVIVGARVIDPTGISLTNTELLMIEGHTAELIAIVHPDNATDKTVTWTSSDESIATVDQNGIVTAIKQGNAVISATTVNGNQANCYVTVVPDIIPVAEIRLSDTEVDMIEGDTYKLTATILPDNATDKTVTWKSSDKTVATVSEDGVVTAVKAGNAIIYASSSNGLTAECAVTVHPGEIAVTGISLSNTELLMREGDTSELIAIVRPDNATDKTVIWSSSNEEVATVDQNGIVTAIKQGIAIISATSVNGIKADCAVTVVPLIIAVTEITLSDTELHLIEGDIYTLIATIKPENATDKTVTWKSSNRDVATVSENGVVTAVAEGTATIYASSSNGLTAECAVTVEARIIEVTSITLNPDVMSLAEGQTATLAALIEPEDATDKTVIWTSSDPEIAIVKSGYVAALKAGITTITAESSNGKKAYCTVTVYSRPHTPKQLLKKGNGTTCTFITMMDMPDTELSRLGYRFVVGYTDIEGNSKIITETPLRYCHTTPEIYNNPSNDFWVFAVFENEDGTTVNSNLRHLDGREEECFDASIYGYTPNGSRFAGIDGDDWIKVTPTGLHISVPGIEETHVAIYTTAGVQLYSQSYTGETLMIEEINLNQFAHGTYVVAVNCGGEMKSKKIVIR